MNKKQIIVAKVIIWLFAFAPLTRLFWLGFNENLTANPIEFIERSTGTWALIFLLLSLAMTPIRLLTKQVWQIQLRRLLGLWMFFYATLHFATYIWLDFGFLMDLIAEDVIEHPRILVGFLAFVLTIPLAVTSNSYMTKKLKGKWKTLHKSVYLIAILAALHFLLLVKRDLTEPIYYAIVLIVLLGIRVFYHFKKKR